MAAQRRYAATLRRALVDAGFDDVPPSGARMIGVLARRRGPSTLVELSDELDVTRQAASQLAETLVAGRYCERLPAPEDGRKILLHLTERGFAVAKELRAQIMRVERVLAESVGDDDLTATRRTLEALGRIDATSSTASFDEPDSTPAGLGRSVVAG
jgi:DNA-binding MarR family transcriptional regulator